MIYDLVILFLASFLVWVMLAVALTWAVWFKQKLLLVDLLVTCVMAVVVSNLVKLVIPISFRPFNYNGYSPLTLTIPFDTAYPSSHTAMAVAIAITVYFYNRKFAWILLPGAFVVGISRVLANVHYPADIAGGVLIGMIIAQLVHYWSAKRLSRG